MKQERKEQETENVITLPKEVMPWEYLPGFDDENPMEDETPDSIEVVGYRYEK